MNNPNIFDIIISFISNHKHSVCMDLYQKDVRFVFMTHPITSKVVIHRQNLVYNPPNILCDLNIYERQPVSLDMMELTKKLEETNDIIYVSLDYVKQIISETELINLSVILEKKLFDSI